MRFLCSLLGHRAGPETWNDGLYFARCARCGEDLIRPLDGRWLPVPPGLRVVWRTEGRHAMHWTKARSLAHQGKRRRTDR